MNTNQEFHFLEKFKELYQDFPNGKIDKSEQPDFIISNEKGKIGIELTEVFQDSHLNNGQSKFQQLSSDRHSFTTDLINIIEQYISFTFHIAIHFNDFNHLKKSKKHIVLKKAFKSCINQTLNLENKKSITINDFQVLPEEINSITIGRYDGLDSSYDEKPEGGCVSDLTDVHLNEILKKKHKKLKKYQKCNQFWLLIKEGNYYAGSFAEVKVENEFETDFDKIFLLRSNYNELIVIK